MKKIFLLLALFATVFVACSDDDDENGNEKGWVVTMDRIIDYEKEATLVCAGSGKMEIDWGDGTITKDLELPLYEEYDEDFDVEEDLEGSEFTHSYDREGLYKITIKGDVKLTYLDVDCDTVTSLDVTKCPALIRLDCNDNELKTLDVSKCTQLRYLNCYANYFDDNAINFIYNSLPDRIGKEAGIITIEAVGDETIAEKKNWKVR